MEGRWAAGKPYGGEWHDYLYEQAGRTALEAIMRCYAASKFGDYVGNKEGPPAMASGQAAGSGAASAANIETGREDAWL